MLSPWVQLLVHLEAYLLKQPLFVLHNGWMLLAMLKFHMASMSSFCLHCQLGDVGKDWICVEVVVNRSEEN